MSVLEMYIDELNDRIAELEKELATQAGRTQDLETYVEHAERLQHWAQVAESGRYKRPDTGWPAWECALHAFAVAARAIQRLATARDNEKAKLERHRKLTVRTCCKKCKHVAEHNLGDYLALADARDEAMRGG